MIRINEETQEHGRLHFDIFEFDSGRAEAFLCQAFRGKTRKPYQFYSFRTTEQRQAWIDIEKEHEDKNATYREERKAARLAGIAATCEKIQVGAILYTSWGYDQTNIDFYQVIARNGKRGVTIREIGADLAQNTFMGGNVTPVRDKFIGEPMRKMIGEYGIKIASYATATPITENRSYSCSWGH